MDLPHPLLALESLGIPSNVTVAVLIMGASVLFGGKIVRWSIAFVSKEFASLSEEAKAGWSAIFHFPGVFFVTVITLFDPWYAIPSALFFFSILPAVAVKILGAGRKPAEKKPPAPEKPFRPRSEKKIKRKEEKKEESIKKEEKGGSVIGIKDLIKEKLLKAKKKVSKAKIKIEEIKIEEKPKKPAPRRAPGSRIEEIKIPTLKEAKKTPVKEERKEEPKEEPKEEMERKKQMTDVEILKKTLDTIEKKYLKGKTMPKPPAEEKEEMPKEEKDVEKVMKEIEEEVTRTARAHKFLTWKEARELKKKTREMIEGRKGEIRERINKGENIRKIAEEIYMQVSKEEFPEERPGRKAPREEEVAEEIYKTPSIIEELEEKPEEKPKKEAKKESEEEDLLALLEKEGGEESVQESEELEELEKLLKES